nr:SrbL [Sorangiineae bacterium]
MMRLVFCAALVAASACLVEGVARAQDPPPSEPPRQADEVLPPVLASSIEATYPPEALAQRLEATVVLRLTVDAVGHVSAAEPVQPAGHGFDEAAREAALHFSFSPAQRNGRAVAARILYSYEFRLPALPHPNPPPGGREPGRPSLHREPGRLSLHREPGAPPQGGRTFRLPPPPGEGWGGGVQRPPTSR